MSDQKKIELFYAELIEKARSGDFDSYEALTIRIINALTQGKPVPEPIATYLANGFRDVLAGAPANKALYIPSESKRKKTPVRKLSCFAVYQKVSSKLNSKPGIALVEACEEVANNEIEMHGFCQYKSPENILAMFYEGKKLYEEV